MTFDPVDVNDGNSLAECLLQLVPEFFTSSWRARIISETGRNWKLKVPSCVWCIHHCLFCRLFFCVFLMMVIV